MKNKSNHPLSHLIPSRAFADKYVSRKVGGYTDLDVLDYARRAQENVMIYGPTGPGKTSFVLAYAARNNLPVVTIQCNGAIDPASFWGQITFDDSGDIAGWVDSDVTTVIENGGILYLDEVNFTPPKIMSVFHSLTDDRRVVTILEQGNRVIKAHPDLLVVAAYNPDYEGTRPLNAAFKNRFDLKMHFGYDPDVEAELICMPVMAEIAAKLRASHDQGAIMTPVSTNALMKFEVFALDFSIQFAILNFVNSFHVDEQSAVTEVFSIYESELKKQVEEMKKVMS